MTMISQYLRAERLDTSEPVSFYIPGQESWTEWSARVRHSVHKGRTDPETDISTEDISFKVEE